ncbi:MAG TPA: ABC transporter permease [Nitrospiraceae bacterium]|jgi:ABC-2 type transport system permease protein
MPGELRKLAAFLRRDLLVLISYRTAFVSDVVNLAFQSLVFSFVGKIVNPTSLPSYGGENVSYIAFVTVGIALGAFLQVGLGRVSTALRSEQMMGTLESLFMTPTHPLTIQVGLVAYDLIYVPVRTVIFLTIIVGIFDVRFIPGAIGPALVLLLAFMPFVWGLGMVGASAILTFRRGAGIMALLGAGLAVGSGAYFPITVFPQWLQDIVRWSPITVAFEATRQALIGGHAWRRLAPEMLYLAATGAFAMVLGLMFFRWAINRELRLGTIAHY